MSSISRSMYQKLAEENKRLLADINILCCADAFDSVWEIAEIKKKWRKFFNNKQDFMNGIKEAAFGFDAIKGKPILHLNLTAKWFDMIEQRIKLHEYREYSDYWKRFFVRKMEESGEMMDKIKIKGKYYNPTDVIICFSNGYNKNRRQVYVEIKEFGRGYGREDWGAIPNRRYFILTLGNILLKLNCKPTN